MGVFNHVISSQIDLVHQRETFARISCSRSRDALSLFSCAKMAAMTSREKSLPSDQDLLLQWHYKICRSKLHFFVSWPAVGIGCFRDTGKRAISTLEGRSFLLTGSYRSRRYAIEKCAQAAYKRGYKLFAVQHGGWCAASRNGHRTYARYGKSNRCRNGKGGPWANDVYVLRGGFPVVNLWMNLVQNLWTNLTQMFQYFL